MLKSLLVNAIEIDIPRAWRVYKDHWVNNISDYPSVDAKIVIGTDATVLHPFNVVNMDNTPVEYLGARLMMSALSGRYLAMGHLGVNHFHPIRFTEFSQDDEGLFYSGPGSPLATISSDDEANIQEISSEDEDEDEDEDDDDGDDDVGSGQANTQEVQTTQDSQDFL